MTVFQSRAQAPVIVHIVDTPQEADVVRRSSEASIDSTFTADREVKKPVEVPVKKTARVKFDLSKTVKYDTPAMDYTESNERWFGRFDYKLFKHEFIEIGRKYQEEDELDMNPYSFNQVLIKSFDACCRADEDALSCLMKADDEQAFRKLLSKGTRRGTIRVSVLSIFIDKSTRRKQLNNAVLATQERCQYQNFWDRAESIRSASEAITRPSRLFAWRIAY